MKVLRVINTLNIGGAERSIIGNVPLHISHNIETDVLLLNGRNTFFIDELKKKNVKIFSLAKHEGVLRLYNPFHVFKIMKYIDKYDIVHAHLFPALYWVAIAKILKRSKTKLVLTEHQTYNRRRKYGWFFRKIDGYLYKQFETIIAISPECKSNLEEHIGKSDKIKMIYNGIDFSPFNSSEIIPVLDFIPETTDSKKIIITQIAAFRKEKDQDSVIRALKHLPSNYYVVFVGDGERKSNCEKLAKTEKVDNRIFFLGFREDVVDILKSSDIIVMSSYFEGFGRSAVEGMAAEKPILATNVPGLSQIIDEGGLLFEVGDDKRLAELIIKVSQDKELYDRLAKTGKEKARIFDLETMVEKYEEVYHELIK